MSLITVTVCVVMSFIALDYVVSPQQTVTSQEELTTSMEAGSGDDVFLLHFGKMSLAFSSYGYIAVGILSIIGNVLNIIVMGRQKGISPYTYLTVLAVCDLGAGLALTWMGVMNNIEFQQQHRLIAEVSAESMVLMFFLKDAFNLGAMYLTAALSLDRLVAVKFPLQRSLWCTVRRARIASGVLVTLGFLLYTHTLARLKMTWQPDITTGLQFPKISFTKFGMTQVVIDTVLYENLIVNMMLPLVVMAISNTMTLQQMARSEKFQRETCMKDPNSKARTAGAHCLALTIGVIITYFVTSIPRLGYTMYVSIHGYPKRMTLVVAFLAMLSEMIASTNCCSNFFIYTILNKKFRDDLASLLSLKKKANIARHSSVYLSGSAESKNTEL